MSRIMWALCAAVLMGATATSRATTISLRDLRYDRSIGAILKPTGPTQLMGLHGGFENYGAKSARVEDPSVSGWSSGLARFNQPISQFTITVTTLTDRPWSPHFVLAGFDKGKRVGREIFRLRRNGASTVFTLTAPAIDRVRWHGENYLLSPYIVGVQMTTVASVASPPPAAGGSGDPSVGASLPEPNAMTILMSLGFLVLLRRPEQRHGK